MSDIEFISGLIAKAPNPKAPEFVKASLSIKRLELIAWLQGREEEWINADIKESKGGKYYVAVNAYKAGEERAQREPAQRQAPRPVASDAWADDADLPF